MNSWYKYLEEIMADFECPYCGKGHEASEINIPDKYYEEECDDCGKLFQVTVEYYPEYEAHKADCLNDDNHKWEPYAKSYIRNGHIQCPSCHEEQYITWEQTVALFDPEALLENLLYSIDVHCQYHDKESYTALNLNESREAKLFESIVEKLMDIPVTISDKPTGFIEPNGRIDRI